jgi:uncharacterized protein YecE (DUF72 family)
MNSVRVGPAGWSYKDWEGTVYPPHGSRFDHLSYLAQYFDTIEINSPFYRIPPDTHARSWVRRVEANPRFKFTTKLYRGFTHEETWPAGDVDAFKRYLEPLSDAERLGALLIQFPWSFKGGGSSEDRLNELFAAFAEYPLALEVRHGSFQNEEFYQFLDRRGVSFVNIDQPLFSDSVKPSKVITGTLGYVRLHGRNYKKWFAHDESWERYDYLYTPDELRPWVDRVNEMRKQRDVFVVMNNHFRGQAVVNALDMQDSLGMPSDIPPQIAETYRDRVPPATGR